MPLLVRPAGDVDAAAQGARHLQAVDHAHRAIQPAGMRLGLEMAADQQERPLPSPAADDVADAVDLGIQPGLGQARGEPVPRLDVVRRVGRPVHPGPVGADRPQRRAGRPANACRRFCSWSPLPCLAAGSIRPAWGRSRRPCRSAPITIARGTARCAAGRADRCPPPGDTPPGAPPRQSRRAPWPAARRTPDCSICPSSGSRRIAARSPHCRPGRAGRSRSPPSRRSPPPGPPRPAAFASAAWSFTMKARLLRHRLEHLARLLLDELLPISSVNSGCSMPACCSNALALAMSRAGPDGRDPNSGCRAPRTGSTG